MGRTLRFPRFKKLRIDKRWDQALSIHEWAELQDVVEQQQEEKEQEFKIDQSRRKKARTSKKPLVIAGHQENQGRTRSTCQSKRWKDCAA
jgi:DNA ligase-4